MPGETNDLKGAVATQTPEGNEGQTLGKAETFTKKQVEDAVAKAKSDTLTDYKRLETEFNRSQSVAQAAISRLKEIEDEGYRRQEEAARDDPDELSRIRRRRQDAAREVELTDRETKVKTQLDRLLKVSAKALSQQYSVSEETLLRYAGGDADSMAELAKSFGERKPAGDSDDKSKQRMTQPPDDGKTKGGGAGLTIEDVRKMSPEEQNTRRAEIAKLSLTPS